MRLVQTANQSQGKGSNTTGHAPSKHPTHLNNRKVVPRASDDEQGPVKQRLSPKEKHPNKHPPPHLNKHPPSHLNNTSHPIK